MTFNIEILQLIYKFLRKMKFFLNFKEIYIFYRNYIKIIKSLLLEK
jgi:hypothetical protein